MKIDEEHAHYYMGSLFYSLVRLMANGMAELSLTLSRLAVFYKQRDFYFYPAWTYSIPAVILKIPFSMLDAFLWTVLTYYVIGYSPEPERFVYQELDHRFLNYFTVYNKTVKGPPSKFFILNVRFFKQLILLFMVHQVSTSFFRLIASVVRNPSVAATCALFSLTVIFLFGGFVIPKCKEVH